MKPKFRLLALITFLVTVSANLNHLVTLGQLGLKYQSKNHSELLVQFPVYLATSGVLAQTTNSKENEAERLSSQGLEQFKRGQITAAIQSLQQALTLYRKIGDRKGEADSIMSLGVFHLNLDQNQKALDLYQQSLAIYQDIGYRKGEVHSLINLGFAYNKLRQYKKTIKCTQQSLAISREIRYRHGEINSLKPLKTAYHNLGQYPKVLELHQQSLAIYQKIGDQQGEATSLLNLGNVSNRLGQYQKALDLLQQSLAIFREIRDKRGEAYSLNYLGNVYLNLEQEQNALKFIQQSLAIFREIGNKKGEAISLINFGTVYRNLGQEQNALKFIQQSLAIFREIGNKKGEANSLETLGYIYRNVGQYQKAQELIRQSLAIYQEIGDRKRQATCLNSLATAYLYLGQNQKALKSMQQSLAIYQEIGDRKSAAHSLINLGNAYFSLGQKQKALKSMQQSLAIFREIGNKQGEANALNYLGETYIYLGHSQKALKFIQSSLATYRKLGNRRGEAISLNSLGGVYLSINNNQKALDFFQQSWAIEKELGDRGSEINSLINLGITYNLIKQYTKAERLLFRAIEIHDSRRSSQLSDADKIFFFDTQWEAHHSLQRTLVAQNKTNTALEVAERGRARAFVELLASRLFSQSDTQQTITPPTALQMQQIAKAHNATLVQYSIIRDPKKFGSPKKRPAQKLFIWVIPPSGRIIFRWIDLQPFLKNTSLQNLTSHSHSALPVAPDFSGIVTPRDTLKSNIAKFINKKFAIILFILLGTSVIVITIRCKRFILTPKNKHSQSNKTTKTRVVLQYKSKNKSLLKKPIICWSLVFLATVGCGSGIFYWMSYNQFFGINNTHFTLTQKPDSLVSVVMNTRASLAEKETLLQKLIRGLGIVPKGQNASQSDKLQQLHQILIDPIADLLPTDPNSHVIFIPQHELFLVPFPALKDKEGNYLIEKHTILTAPSIQTLSLTRQQKERIAGKQENKKAGENVLIVGNPTMPSIPPIPGEPPQQLASLPGAEAEAKAIAQLLNTQPIIGKNATKSAILQKMPSARIIHLATHGLLDEYRGLGSAIALAPNPNYQEKIGEVNGLLTAEEILDLKLNASLVVLSACDTGRGRITGDGVVGLSRSLISAGVPSVLVSLWSVPDAPTAFLMTELYQNLQNNPDKAQALRQAMLTTMKEHPNPIDWAAFTLIGEAE